MRSPRSNALGAHRWDPRKFSLIKRSFWLDGMKRGLRNKGVVNGDRLFVYRARATGIPVLGYWCKERPGGSRYFVSLAQITPNITLKFLQLRIRPARRQAKAGLKAVMEEAYLERKAHEAEDDAKTEWLKWIKKKDDQLYRRVKMGMTPVSFTPPSEETMEHVARMISAGQKRQSIVKG